MLSLWRRHLAGCTHRDKAARIPTVLVPMWVDGDLKGKRVRQSLNTRDWKRELSQAGAHGRSGRLQPDVRTNRGCEQPVESGRCDRHTRALSAAVASFHEGTQDLAHGTLRNYKRALRFMEAWDCHG